MDIPIIPVNPKNALEEKIAEVALMFDFTATKTIECKVLGTVIRFLGCAPTEADLNKICKETEFENELQGYIPISTLMEHVVELLIQKKMKPVGPNTLLEAFRILDPECTGYIDPAYFREIMLSVGEPFNEDELKEMLRGAIDSETGLIAYEYYINKLVHKDMTVYRMAEEMLKQREAAKAAAAAKRNFFKKA